MPGIFKVEKARMQTNTSASVEGWRVTFIGEANWKLHCENEGSQRVLFGVTPIELDTTSIQIEHGDYILVYPKNPINRTLPYTEIPTSVLIVFFHLSIIPEDGANLNDFFNNLGKLPSIEPLAQQVELTWEENHKMRIFL